MFNRQGIEQLHGWTHQSLDIVLNHISTVAPERLREALPGFGIPTVWKQLTHVLEVEEAWVCALQSKPRLRWRDEDCPNLNALLANKRRVQDATRAYLDSLTETQLNATLATRPNEWVGELKSPAFILLHVVTHTFHHKGQVVAMLRTLGYPAPDTDLQRG
jgi:uncharacterized damage-inducible protein DinB